jgi:hypothetical protein
MPALHRLQWTPGVNTQGTRTQNRAGWFACNLIRWRNGLLEKVAGWQRLYETRAQSIIRALHAYEDLTPEKNLLVGTSTGLQIFVDGVLHDTQAMRTIGYWDQSGNTPVATITPNGVGSKVVKINQVKHGAHPGDIVQVKVTFTVGGRRIAGGTTVMVDTVVDADNWTFQMASNATNTNPGTMAQFEISTQPPSTMSGKIFLTDHGYSVGQSYHVTALTQWSGITEGLGALSISIPAGTNLTVTAVESTDVFDFNPAPWIVSHDPYSGAGFLEGQITPGNFLAGGIFWYVGGSVAGIGSEDDADVTLDNLGTNGLICYSGGPLFIYEPPIASGAIVVNAGVSSAPQVQTGILTAMPQAQVISFGSEVILGEGVQDPLLVRFSDAGSYSEWTASSENQAGSFRLGGTGSRIVGAIQAPQATLLFTDADAWSMQYVGPPFVYSFTVIGSGCGLVGIHARAVLGRTCLWVSRKGLFAFSDSGVAPVTCPVWDIIFTDLDQNNLRKVFCGTNASAHEIWIFYPSISGGTGECDKYIKVNIAENLWDYGTMTRSAWFQESLYGGPLAADVNFRVQEHELGFDDDGFPMEGVFAETGYVDLEEGNHIMLVDEFIPDMKWFGGNVGAVSVLLLGTNYPGQKPTIKGPYFMDETNRHIRPRLRARQLAARFDWIDRLGYSARLGTPRARIVQAGRRP